MQMSDLMDCCGMLLTSNWFDNSVYQIFFRNQIVLDGASFLNLFCDELLNRLYPFFGLKSAHQPQANFTKPIKVDSNQPD